MQDALLDVQDVAERLKLNPRTVIRMAERGDLAAAKVARRWRFRSRDVDEYLQTQIEETQGHGLKYQWSIDAQADGINQVKAQNMEVGEQEQQLAAVKQQLELKKQRLELQKERLDLETKRIDYALEMVDLLHPTMDANKKADFFQNFLHDLLLRPDPVSPV